MIFFSKKALGNFGYKRSKTMLTIKHVYKNTLEMCISQFSIENITFSILLLPMSAHSLKPVFVTGVPFTFFYKM